MSVRSIEVLQRYLRQSRETAEPPEDERLLKQLVISNDREAFERLIARHGPMVLGTARRLVNEPHDADDVFQAVFLSFARLAKSIRQANTIPAWLYKTTCRIAAKARKNRVTQLQSSTEPCEIIDPDAGLFWREVRVALDEELRRLPERLRSPLLLCYLSGLARDEAAKQLGWSLGTLKRRLEQGRKLLRTRLERRGIAAAGLIAAVLTPEAMQGAVTKSLVEATLTAVFSKGALAPATVSILVLHSAATMKGLAMKSFFAVVAIAGIGVGLYAGMGQSDPPPKAEGKREAVKPADAEQVVQLDDPLPAGSALRFGTSRFRQGVQIVTMAVSADGKTAYVVSGTRSNGSTRAIDLVNGRSLFNIANEEGEAIAISPDGRTIVVKQSLRLHIRDSKTGQPLRSIEISSKSNLRSEADVLAFLPDGKGIVTITDSKDLHLVDFESGKPIRDFLHENPEPSNTFPQVLTVAFSPNGKLMATGGYSKVKDDYFARLWDVETGTEIRRFMHGQKGYGIRCLAFSHDGKTLATIGTQSGVFLRLFDVDTGKERRAFPKDGNQRTSSGSVAFSPNGKMVAAALGSIHVYDTTTGEERLRIARMASNLHFADDGKTLVGAVDGAIHRWDTVTGKALTPETGDSTVAQILVSADGRRVVTRGEGGDAHVWDGTNGKHLRGIQARWQQNMAMSPDGRFLAWPVGDSSVTYTVPHEPRSIHDGSRIRLYDIAADKFVDRFPAFKGNAQDLAFTSDGKKLVTVDKHGAMVRIWNVESGKEEQSFAAMPVAPKNKILQVGRTLLSPGGKTVAMTYEETDGSGVDRLGRGLADRPHLVRLWDVASGKQHPELNGGYPVDGAFSPDGRFVVTAGGNFVHEIATGRRVAALPDELYVRAAAFSRDGRFLATAVHDGVIHIWEVATWTKRNEFKGYQDRSITLTFGPGGRLFCGNLDTTVLAWDTLPPLVADSVSLESAWNALATRESGESFKSEGKFLAAPASAVGLFAEKVKRVEALDSKRIQGLLVDLGSDVFAVREAATKELNGLNEQTIPHLEASLKSTASAEVRERVTRILEQKRRTALTSEQVRQTRAAMVLELIGDDASKNLLKKWAGGPAGAQLTLEASAALRRLEGTPEVKR